MVELFMDSMPLTASNFMDLADSGFYNGIHFHRVIDNFMTRAFLDAPGHPLLGFSSACQNLTLLTTPP